jgi:putative endonuclease
MWFVYILEAANKSLYTGITTDVKRRMLQHKQGKGAKYTRNFGFKKLLYTQELPSRSQALKREAEIKKLSRRQKLQVINIKDNKNESKF